MTILQPGHIFGRGGGEEIGQFVEGNSLTKLRHSAGGQLQINELKDKFFQGVLTCMHEAVKFRLRPVQRVGLLIPACRDGFYFLKQDAFGRDQQTVNPAADQQREFVHLHPMFHGQFGEIASRTRALYFLVTTDAGKRPIGADKLTRAAEIAPPQDEFHQVAHGNCVDGFCRILAHGSFHSCSGKSQTPSASRGGFAVIP